MKRCLFGLMLCTALMLAAPVFHNMSGSVFAADATPVGDSFADPAMEMRARNLQRQLRCLMCQGESIDESGSSFAANIRHLVRQQMAAGKSDAQIQAFLVARYGNFILMKPPLEPDTYFLWLAPFLVLIGAGGVAFWVIARARRMPSV